MTGWRVPAAFNQMSTWHRAYVGVASCVTWGANQHWPSYAKVNVSTDKFLQHDVILNMMGAYSTGSCDQPV